MSARFLRVLLLAVTATFTSGCAPVIDAYEEMFKLFEDEPPKVSQRCQAVTTREVTHKIRRGETLSEIGQCYRVQWYYIAQRNNISDPKRVKVGQKLVIPDRAWIASSKKTAKQTASKSKPVTRKPYVKPPTRTQSGLEWSWPTQGKVTRKFSAKGSGKKGITIAGKSGQEVLAAATGEVVYAGEGLTGYGRLLIVQHPKDFLTAYAHNDVLLVHEGDRVAGGQVIAHMGKTAAKSPQLHFEVRYRGNPVDPFKYLPKR